MDFLKDFLRNILILVAIVVVLFIFSPDIMKQVFQVYGALFGPLAIIRVFVFALPRRKRRR